MKFSHFLLWMLCFPLASAKASQNIEIDSTNLIKCTLSARHHNRIAVEGQRIKKVIYPEGDILIRMEEESGQIFVQAMIDNPPETTVSIITSSGLVQDFEFMFSDKAAEIVILKEKPSEELNFLEFSECAFGDESSAIQRAIEIILAGETPEEYIPVEDRQICCRIKRGVILKSTMRLVGPLYTVYVMTIENKGRNRECILEKEINCINGEWIFIEKSELERDEKMLALIGVKTNEQ